MVDLMNVDVIPTEQIKGVASLIWRDAPAQALRLYSGLLLAGTIGIAPLAAKMPPAMTLPCASFAALGSLLISKELEDLQEDLDEAREIYDHNRATRIQGRTMVNQSQAYAQTMQRRLAIGNTLPEGIREPDLLPQTKQPTATSAAEAEFEKLAANRAPLASKKETAVTSETPVTDNTPTACPIPVVDIAIAMAKDERSVLGIGSTGTGKTTLLVNAMAAQVAIDETSDFTGFAHKSPNTAKGETLPFAGLEDTEDVILFTATMQGNELLRQARKFETRLSLITRLIETGSLTPSVVVIDQSNQGLSACKSAYLQAQTDRKNFNARQDPGEKDTTEIDFKNLQHAYSVLLTSGVVDGRDKNVKVWNLGHSSTNSSLGMDQSEKNNVSFIGLGRKGYNSKGELYSNWAGVTKLLEDKRFIKTKDERDKIRVQLNSFLAYMKTGSAPNEITIALTDVGAMGYRLAVLPKYDRDVKVLFNPVTNPPLENDKPTEADREVSIIDGLNKLLTLEIDEPTEEPDDAVKTSEVLKVLSTRHPGTTLTFKQFLDASRALRQVHKVKVEFLRELFPRLEEMGIVSISADKKMFTYLGGIDE